MCGDFAEFVALVCGPAKFAGLTDQAARKRASDILRRRLSEQRPVRPFAQLWNRASSDADLVAACLAGESAAWDALIDRYKALIYSIPLRYGLADADASDIFQQVCITLLTHLKDLRNDERLAGWLVTTTRNEVTQLYRHRGRGGGTLSLDDEDACGERPAACSGECISAEQTVLDLERRYLVYQALGQLPERCQQLLLLLYCEDPPCSYAEAARRLHIPQNSIGPSRARCLNSLKKILSTMGF